MSVVVRGIIQLQAGCRLYCDCPLGGESYESMNFFDKYRGKYARFVEYSHELVGVLDRKGRVPGQYIHDKGFKVRFDGEEKVHELNKQHFIVVEPSKATLVNEADDQRVGDLPNPILFYPGDSVRIKKQGDLFDESVHRVGSVFVGDKRFAPEGVIRYDLLESEQKILERRKKFEEEKRGKSAIEVLHMHVPLYTLGQSQLGDELELVARGNVWALYRDPTKLSFSTDEEEATFWAQSGISQHVSSSADKERGIEAHIMRSAFGYPKLKQSWGIFEAGEADLIATHNVRFLDESDKYNVLKLHDCFAQHRERVRALTQRLWAEKATQSAVA